MDDLMECDQSWDFDAPQFVDFKTTKYLPEDDEAESYFDFDHENGVPVNFNESQEEIDDFQTPKSTFTRTTRSSAKKPPKENAGTPQRVTRAKTPKGEEQISVQENTKENVTPVSQNIPMRKSFSTSKLPDVTVPQKQPSNLCTNQAEWDKKKTVAANNRNPTAPVGQEKTKEVLQKTGTKREYRSLERSSSCRLAKKSKDTVPVRGTTPRSRGTTPRKGSTERKEHEKPRPMTVSTTPTCLKRRPVKLVNHEPVKKSEDIELEKIEYYKNELAKKRKMAAESYKMAKQGKAPTVVNHKDPTKPIGFHFETDGRLKTHGMESRQDTNVKDFASVLRSNKDKSSAHGPMKAGPTKPEPFQFAEQRKRKLPDMDAKQAEKYESMAQKLAQFNATPERFRSKPKVGGLHSRGRSRSPPHAVTIPKTPQFETRTRTRPVTAPTREALEEKEVEELKKHQFKAHPVDHRIFANSKMGVKKVQPKPPTVPEGFHLSSDKKALNREYGSEQERYEFHAQPLNKKILEGVVGVHEVKKSLPTVPESPAFALKHRARVPVMHAEEKEEKAHSLRSRAVPHYGVPFQPTYQHRTTEPAPFGFEEREKAKAELKARKMEETMEEEARLREFHANPLPDLEPHLPRKKTKPATVQQPFNLDTEVRGMKKAEEWSNKMEEELRQQKEKAKFRAREPHVLESEPFVPAKSHKHTEEFTEFELSTAKRHVKREVFEMHKKTKQDELDNIRKQEQKMKEAEEQADLDRLRQEAVHKAKPVKHYKGVTVQASDKPLTTALSPRFKTDQRLRLRSLMSDSANSFSSS